MELLNVWSQKRFSGASSNAAAPRTVSTAGRPRGCHIIFVFLPPFQDSTVVTAVAVPASAGTSLVAKTSASRVSTPVPHASATALAVILLHPVLLHSSPTATVTSTTTPRSAVRLVSLIVYESGATLEVCDLRLHTQCDSVTVTHGVAELYPWRYPEIDLKPTTGTTLF